MPRSVVNFRFPTQKHRLLRIALLQEGITLQAFFSAVAEQKLQAVRGTVIDNGEGGHAQADEEKGRD